AVAPLEVELGRPLDRRAREERLEGEQAEPLPAGDRLLSGALDGALPGDAGRGGSDLADVAERDPAVTDRRDLVENDRGVWRELDVEALRELCDPGQLVRARRDHRAPLALQPSLEVDGRAVALEVARAGQDEVGEVAERPLEHPDPDHRLG